MFNISLISDFVQIDDDSFSVNNSINKQAVSALKNNFIFSIYNILSLQKWV